MPYGTPAKMKGSWMSKHVQDLFKEMPIDNRASALEMNKGSGILKHGKPHNKDERSGTDLDPKVQEQLKNFKAKQLEPKSGSERSKAEAQKQIDKIVDTTGKSPSVATSGRPTNVPYELHAKYDYHAKKGTTDKFLKEQGLSL